MPLPLSTSDTFDVILDSDKDRVEPRPVFRFRYQSLREWRSMAWLFDDEKRLRSMSASDAMDAVLTAIKTNLVGWDHMADRAYNPDDLDDILNAGEAWELLGKARAQNAVSVPEKNLSGLPPSTSTGKSADVANPEDALTGPPQANPSL